MPYFASHNLLAKILGSLTSDILRPRMFNSICGQWIVNTSELTELKAKRTKDKDLSPKANIEQYKCADCMPQHCPAIEVTKSQRADIARIFAYSSICSYLQQPDHETNHRKKELAEADSTQYIAIPDPSFNSYKTWHTWPNMHSRRHGLANQSIDPIRRANP